MAGEDIIILVLQLKLCLSHQLSNTPAGFLCQQSHPFILLFCYGSGEVLKTNRRNLSIGFIRQVLILYLLQINVKNLPQNLGL